MINRILFISKKVVYFSFSSIKLYLRILAVVLFLKKNRIIRIGCLEWLQGFVENLGKIFFAASRTPACQIRLL